MTIARIEQLVADEQDMSRVVYSPRASTWATSTDTAYTGARSFKPSSTASMLGVYSPTAYAAWRCGFYHRHNGIGSGDRTFLVAFSNVINSWASPMLGVAYDAANGVFILRRIASTNNYETLATSDAAPAGWATAGVWRRISAHAVFAQTGGRFAFWIDGTPILDFTGDTRLRGSGGYATDAHYGLMSGIFDNGTATPSLANPMYVDNAYFDAAVGETVAIPPSKLFYAQAVDGAGTHTNLTPTGAASNYQAVDDIPTDDDTTYVAGTAAGLIDTYSTAAAGLQAAADVDAVIVRHRSRKLLVEDGNQIRAKLYDGAFADGSDVDLGVGYASQFERFATQPGGADWSAVAADAVEIGIETRGSF